MNKLHQYSPDYTISSKVNIYKQCHNIKAEAYVQYITEYMIQQWSGYFALAARLAGRTEIAPQDIELALSIRGSLFYLGKKTVLFCI